MKTFVSIVDQDAAKEKALKNANSALEAQRTKVNTM